MSNVPSVRELLGELKDQRWNVERTKNGHYKALAPDGKGISTFADTNEPRAMKNCIADLRRHGFVWPPERNGHRHPQAEAVQQAKPDLDALFQNLKDAKLELSTYEARYEECQTEVRRVEARLAELKGKAKIALEEVDVARRIVMEAKAEFDLVFEGRS